MFVGGPLDLSQTTRRARRMETTEPDPAVKRRRRRGEPVAFVRRACRVCGAVVVYEQRQRTAVCGELVRLAY